jgi:hypothetical protein
MAAMAVFAACWFLAFAGGIWFSRSMTLERQIAELRERRAELLRIEARLQALQSTAPN